MAKVTALKLDTAAIDGLGDKLAAVEPTRLGEFLVETLNDVGQRAYKLARKDITRTINIRDGYVDKRIAQEKASKGRPVYEITAEYGVTNVSHYGAMRLTRTVNWTNATILAKRKKFDEKWPGWVRRKGTPSLGIAADQKQDGASVSIKKGSRKASGAWFSIPGKNDKDTGAPLVFRQNDSGKVEAVLGPAPYQLFRNAIQVLNDDILDDLEQSVLNGVEREILRNL